MNKKSKKGPFHQAGESLDKVNLSRPPKEFR